MVGVCTRSPMRTPSPPPSPQLASRLPVQIRHPAYDSSTNILITFASVDKDQDPSDVEVYGVHFRTVHTASAIVAGNRFDGWIAADQHGCQCVELGDTEILPGGDYWFHVPPPVVTTNSNTLPSPSALHAYPIVPNFRAWKFPDSIPPSFRLSVLEPRYAHQASLSSTSAVRARDISCRLTAEIESVEHAHIIPASEKEWFGRNGMARYAGTRDGRDTIDSEFNAILLREDVHTSFDKMYFSIIPKPDAGGSWYLTAHVTAVNPSSLYKRFHNLRLRPIRGVLPEYLFARFAWDIFPSLRFFLQGEQARWLAVRQENGDTKVQEFTGKECAKMCEGQGIGRSGSPSKRKRGTPQTSTTDLTDAQDSSFMSPEFNGYTLIADEKQECFTWVNGETLHDYCEDQFHLNGTKRHRLIEENDREPAKRQRRHAKRTWESAERWRLISLVTFSAQTSKSLHNTIQSLERYPRVVRELQVELETLQSVLIVLEKTIQSSIATEFTSLELPLRRCGNACKEFEAEIYKCIKHLDRTSILDWSKLNIAGEIDELRRRLAKFKSTIMIALTGANLRTSAMDLNLLNEYSETILDTTLDLEEFLCATDKKLHSDSFSTPERNSYAEQQLNVYEERQSIMQCLIICAQVSEDIGRQYAKVIEGVPLLLDNSEKNNIIPEQVTIRRVTDKALQESGDKLKVASSKLSNQLSLMDSAMPSTGSILDQDTIKQDLDSLRRCLALCGQAATKVINVRTNVTEDASIGGDTSKLRSEDEI